MKTNGKSFEFDESLVPEVELKDRWDMDNGNAYEIYEADGWQFELFTDEHVDEIGHAKKAIYAWIAWLNWLENNNEK